MTDTTQHDDRTDRRAALDRFADAPPIQNENGNALVRAMQSPADRVFGAQQVAVYRNDAQVLQKLSALGAAAGDDWFYRYPVKNKRENRTDWIEGPSIKLANDVARIYGNCDVDTRVMDLGDSWVIYARFTDFETGFSLTRPYQQRKSGSKMGGDDDSRRLDIAFQIGVSKACRNVVVNALQTYADYAFEAARNSLVDKIGKDLPKWRERVVSGIGNIPVELARVEKVIGRAAKDWLAPDVARIVAMMKAISDGMASVDETFPAADKQVGADTSSQAESTEGTSPTTQAGQADPGKQAQRSTSQGVVTDASAAGAATATDKTAAKAETKPKAETKKETAAEHLPDSEPSYIAFANAWREKITDPAEGRARWGQEKGLRNKCNVGPEPRDDLKAKLDAKCAELEKD
jgi:hypothetical protein